MAQAVGSWHLPGFLQGFLPFRTSACTPHQSSSLPIVPALAPPTLVTEYRCICIYRLYRHTYIQYICIYFTTKYKFTLKPVEFGLFGFFFSPNEILFYSQCAELISQSLHWSWQTIHKTNFWEAFLGQDHSAVQYLWPERQDDMK